MRERERIEGNYEKLKDYVTASEQVRKIYTLRRKFLGREKNS